MRALIRRRECSIFPSILANGRLSFTRLVFLASKKIDSCFWLAFNPCSLESLQIDKIPLIAVASLKILERVGVDVNFFDGFRPQENADDAFAFIMAVHQSFKLYQKDLLRAKHVVYFLLLYCSIKWNRPEVTSLYTKNQILGNCKVKASHLVLLKIFEGTKHGSGFINCRINREIVSRLQDLQALYRSSPQHFWARLNG